jgi:hypothetical protein
MVHTATSHKGLRGCLLQLETAFLIEKIETFFQSDDLIFYLVREMTFDIVYLENIADNVCTCTAR